MKALPKRKGNPLPWRKCEYLHYASMKALPKRKGNKYFTAETFSDKMPQ